MRYHLLETYLGIAAMLNAVDGGSVRGKHLHREMFTREMFRRAAKACGLSTSRGDALHRLISSIEEEALVAPEQAEALNEFRPLIDWAQWKSALDILRAQGVRRPDRMPAVLRIGAVERLLLSKSGLDTTTFEQAAAT